MSKTKHQVPVGTAPQAQKNNNESKGFTIPYPVLWLCLAALAVYFQSFYFGITELDDSIFIRDFHTYNEDLGNLFTSFGRGVFDAVKDPYYRPLFLDSMILNYHLSGGGENIVSYHIVNVLLHIISVVLLFRLFKKLGVKELHAFLLTLVFAVHPVLSQAVAWIPGRNDTLLAVFTLAFFNCSISYSATGKSKDLLLSALFLLLAFFTKETAVFIAPAAFVLLMGVLRHNWQHKRQMVQYGIWIGCFVLWFAVRAIATIQTQSLSPGQVAGDFFHRLPLVLQYLGKIFLPVNLSVFPIQEDTVIYYGLAALTLLAIIILLYRQRNISVLLSGLGIFLLFLLPALIVPNNLNEQTFEHRLYLPMIGMLLMCSQTLLLHNKLSDKALLYAGTALCALLAFMNIKHQKNFSDPLTFWSAAAESSPNSAYANMMLAARLGQDEFERSASLFRKAYQLNPKEKYLNFYYGVMLQKKDSVMASEKYLMAEKNSSNYYECDFYLARVAMEKKDLLSAITYLKDYLKNDPSNKVANGNLLLLYMDTNQRDAAIAHARHMQLLGFAPPPEILKKLGM